MGAIASQITSLTIVYSTFYSGAYKEKSKFRVTDLCPVTGEFPAQMASNAENVSISWRHRDNHFCTALLFSSVVCIFVCTNVYVYFHIVYYYHHHIIYD